MKGNKHPENSSSSIFVSLQLLLTHKLLLLQLLSLEFTESHWVKTPNLGIDSSELFCT